MAHPVRLRIVHAMRGGRVLTTAQLCARVPDASKAMVYRHVDLLETGGVLEVAEERRVRGAVERGYRLRQDRAAIDPGDIASATTEDFKRSFATALAALVAEFNAYLERDDVDPIADLVGYRQHAVWLSREELLELIGAMQKAIVPVLANEPGPDRAQYLLSPIHFPIAEAHDDPGPEHGG
nr:helix-turn-helix domain-containing protein [Amycolatopsis umgeniensis]